MTAIKDTERAGNQKLDGIRRRQDSEVKNLVNNHQKYKTELNKAQESDIVDVQYVHKTQLNNEGLKKEKVLEEMKKNLEISKKMTDKEIKDLKETHFNAKTQDEQKLSDDRERMHMTNQMHLDDMNDQFNNQAKKINSEGQNSLQTANQSFTELKLQNEDFHRGRIQNQTEGFTTRFNADEAKYEKLKYEQDNFQKKERFSTNLRQQSEMTKMVDNHIKQLEIRDENFRKGLKDQDLFFEKKYLNHLNKNNTDLKGLNDLNQKVVATLKTELAKQVKNAVVKSDDPFYQFTELQPQMTQFEDRVEVKVRVPEYSKQDLLLTLNKKDININFNRRYTDTNNALDGSVNKINKVETFSTRLSANNFLDPKSVKNSYENGVMTYIIKHA